MSSAQIQLKISLSGQLNDFLVSKAARLGVPVTQFVKHLILKEVENEEYPIFKASPWLEKKTSEALAQRNKAIRVTNIEEFFKKL